MKPSIAALYWIAALGLLSILSTSCTRHPSPQGWEGPPPDSLRSKVTMTIWDKSAQDVNATILAIPGERYRAEFTGPLGVSVASLLWQPQGWTLLLHRDETYLQGTGEYLILPGVLLPPIRIHDAMGILWGQAPKGGDTRAAGDTLEWSREGKRVFRMVVESRDTSAHWSPSAWTLSIPEGYQPL